MRTTKTRKGAVLIVVLGVLMVLSLLGVSYAQLAQMDRQTARSYLDSVRARLVARAGVEQAVSRLEAIDLLRDGTWIYPGGVALEDTTQPSFAALNPSSGAPMTVLIEGQPRGYTDVMSQSAHAQNGDLFALKIVDANAQLNVNDGVRWGAGHSVSRNLRRMLRVLGTIRGVSQTQTDRIVDLRPASGYRSKLEVLTVLGSQSDFDKLKDYIAIHAWQDTSVCEPVPLSQQALAAYPSDITYFRGNNIYRCGRQKNSRGQTMNQEMLFYPSGLINDDRIKTYAMDELNPQWIETVARAPVNINGASREVLVSVLADLHGFFRVERRQNNPTRALTTASSPGHLGMPPSERWTGDKLDYATAYTAGGPNSDEDDSGLLIATVPLAAPSGPLPTGTAAMVPNSALSIADEIIACRKRITGPSGFNYATASFGGPFRNWAQFAVFCDNLVAAGVLADNRPIYNDALQGNSTPVSSQQRAVANRAMADVLKANFNPNLHLNELNPDANLALHVDKTDLIVHSTEFCFAPPGRFEIESLGRILRRLTPAGTMTSPINHAVVAEAKVVATVKLWEAFRQTSQKQFQAGAVTAANFVGAAQTVSTNSNRQLEIGPEPANGTAPAETEWDGYIALATNGGDGVVAAPGGVVTSSNGSSTTGEWLRAHFQHDFDASFHQYGAQFRREMNRNVISNEDTALNHPDKNIAVAGPYDPTFPAPNQHRLARSFSMPPAMGSTMTGPTLAATVPSDLRVDGGYSERNGAPGYQVMYGLEFQRTTVTTTVTSPDSG